MGWQYLSLSHRRMSALCFRHFLFATTLLTKLLPSKRLSSMLSSMSVARGGAMPMMMLRLTLMFRDRARLQGVFPA